MPSISRRTFVAAPADVVWNLTEDFAQWHPKLPIYADGPDASAELVVTVVSRDDDTRTLSYRMPEPPFAIKNHLATIQVEEPNPDEACCYVSWSAEFVADEADMDALEDQIGDDIFSKALDNLATEAQNSYGESQVKALA